MPFYIAENPEEKSWKLLRGIELGAIPSKGIGCMLSAESFDIEPLSNRIAFGLRAARAMHKYIVPTFDHHIVAGWAHPSSFHDLSRDEEKIRLEAGRRYFEPLLEYNIRTNLICHSMGGIVLKDIFLKLGARTSDTENILVINLGVPVGKSDVVFDFSNEVNISGEKDYDIVSSIKTNRQQLPNNFVSIDTSISTARGNLDPHSLKAYLIAMSRLTHSMSLFRAAVRSEELEPDFTKKLAAELEREGRIIGTRSLKKQDRPDGRS